MTTRAAACLAALLLELLGTAPAAFADTGDPNLDQHISGSEPVVETGRTIDAGHVDMGPKFVDGRWTFMIHDDVAKADASATSVWRYPDKTVLHVVDQAELTAPADSTYGFIGAKAGQKVWVIPQTQNPDVVWVGWNTQDPEVMQRIDRGITLAIGAVQGTGDLSVYLQSGTLGAPQVLRAHDGSGSGPVWVDVNTHTHANWVFTKPGVYLVQVTAAANLLDGSKVTDTEYLRFAVGTSTSSADALAAVWKGPAATSAAAPQAAATGATAGQRRTVQILLTAIFAVAIAMIAGFGLAVMRSSKARRRALAEVAESNRADR